MTTTAVPRSTARLRRIDLRVVIGLALLLAGVLGTVAVVQRAGQRVPVLVMARDVPAGQVVGDQDVRAAELGLAPGVATLGVGDRGRVVGRVTSVPLAAGQVGHHGSRNATPRTLFNLWTEPGTINREMIALLSTKNNVHGESPATAVPRKTLVAALDTRMRQYETRDFAPETSYVELMTDLEAEGGFVEVVGPR